MHQTMVLPEAALTRASSRRHAVPPAVARLLLLAVIAAAAVAGTLFAGAGPTARAVVAEGADLTRLLRAMALLKAAMALAAAGAVLWRLAAAPAPARLAAYVASCSAMAAGPGLIWSMAYIGTGALLLHGGLLTTIVLLWRDPAVAARLGAMITARRTVLRAQA